MTDLDFLASGFVIGGIIFGVAGHLTGPAVRKYIAMCKSEVKVEWSKEKEAIDALYQQELSSKNALIQEAIKAKTVAQAEAEAARKDLIQIKDVLEQKLSVAETAVKHYEEIWMKAAREVAPPAPATEPSPTEGTHWPTPPTGASNS